MSTSAAEILEDLDDDNDDECIYIDRDHDDAYLWAAEEDEMYYLLERSRNGTWFPEPRPITAERAEDHLQLEVVDPDESYEVRPQTKLPPDRHRHDRK